MSAVGQQSGVNFQVIGGQLWSQARLPESHQHTQPKSQYQIIFRLSTRESTAPLLTRHHNSSVNYSNSTNHPNLPPIPFDPTGPYLSTEHVRGGDQLAPGLPTGVVPGRVQEQQTGVARGRPPLRRRPVPGEVVGHWIIGTEERSRRLGGHQGHHQRTVMVGGEWLGQAPVAPPEDCGAGRGGVRAGTRGTTRGLW